MIKWVKILFCVLIIHAFLSCSNSNEDRVIELKRKAKEYLANGQYRNALETLDKASLLGNYDTEVYRIMYDTFQKINDIKSSEKILEVILKKDPKSDYALVELVKINLINNDIEKARKYLEELNKCTNNLSVVYQLEGDIKFLKEDFEDAQIAYELALNNDPFLKMARVKMATAAIAQGKIGISEKQISELNLQGLDSVDVLLEMGNHFDYKNEHDEAEKYYKLAVDMAPDSFHAKERLSDYYIETGNYSDAYLIQKELVSIYPENSQLKKALAETLLMLGDAENARIILNDLITEIEDDQDVILLQGYLNISTQKSIPAITQFETILRKNEQQPLVQYLLGIAYMMSGYSELANRALTNALANFPDFTEAALALAGLHYKNKIYDLSLEYLVDILSHDPINIRALMLSAIVEIETNNFVSAEIYLERILNIEPLHTGALFYLSICYNRTGKNTEALPIIEKLLKLDPIRLNALTLYAEILTEMHMSEQFEVSMDEIIARYPENSHILNVNGVFMYQLGEYEKAIEAFQESSLIQPEIDLPYINLIKLLRQENKLSQQEDTINKALLNLEGCIECSHEAGYLYMTLGNYDKAAEMLEKAQKINPDDPKLANNLAYIYLQQEENLNIALKLAQMAYEKDPSDYYYCDTLGRILEKKGVVEQAKWYIEKADELKSEMVSLDAKDQ